MHWLLRLYPRSWRERYEEEMLAVLEDHKITAATVVDLVIGAIDANFNYEGTSEGVVKMVNRMRSGIVMFFCSFMLFGVGWSLLQRNPVNTLLADPPFHPGFIVVNISIFLLGCFAFLAFVLGGLPVFLVSVKHAFKKKQKDVLAPLSVAVTCLILFALSMGVLADWHHLPYAKDHLLSFLIAYFSVFLVLLLIGTIAVSLMITRTEFQLAHLKFAFIPEIVILFCMVVSVVMKAAYIIALIAQAAQLSNYQYAGSLIYVMGIAMMALAAIFAAMGLKRGMIKEIGQLAH